MHEVPFLLLILYNFEIPCCICQYHAASHNTNISRQNHPPKQKTSSILRHFHYVASLTALHHYYFQNVQYIYIYFVSLYISTHWCPVKFSFMLFSNRIIKIMFHILIVKRVFPAIQLIKILCHRRRVKPITICRQIQSCIVCSLHCPKWNTFLCGETEHKCGTNSISSFTVTTPRCL